MKATNFLWDEPGLVGAWAKLAHALAFPAQGHGHHSEPRSAQRAPERSAGLFERLDRWFWEQELRDREAYLAQAKDVFELEERIRRLERSAGRAFS